MANRTTVKNNIQVINVPTVSNADMNTMLQTNICDNVVFKEDVAVAQTSSVTAITCDFTGKDRIDLTRTGGALQITVSGIADGDKVFLLITKTAGQPVTWVGVTDITPVKYYANALSLVLYEIVRKGSNYFTFAWVETVKIATATTEGVKKITTDTTVRDDSNTDMVITSTLRSRHATTAINGLVKKASQVQFDAGTDSDPGSNSIFPLPSQIKGQLNGIQLKQISFSGWNMDLTSVKSITHLITSGLSKILSVEATVIRNAGDFGYNFLSPYFGSNQIFYDNYTISLTRATGGGFDAAAFNNAYGFVVIKYIL